DAHLFGDIAERIPQDFAAARDGQFGVTAFALVAAPAALAVVVVVGRFDNLLPQEVEYRLRVVGVVQGIVDGRELFGGRQGTRGRTHDPPKVRQGRDNVRPRGRNFAGQFRNAPLVGDFTEILVGSGKREACARDSVIQHREVLGEFLIGCVQIAAPIHVYGA